MKLVSVFLVFLTDLVELPHVLKELGTSLQRNEKLGLLAITPVVRSLNCDGLCPYLLECGVIVPKSDQEMLAINLCGKKVKNVIF